jgi:hypothetical protein
MKSELNTTTHAVIAADGAYLAHLAAAWERRGFLQRLARTDRRAGESGQHAPRQN